MAMSTPICAGRYNSTIFFFLDSLELNDDETFGPALARMNEFLDHVCQSVGQIKKAWVVSDNNVPLQ